jgi:hypothetical protein
LPAGTVVVVTMAITEAVKQSFSQEETMTSLLDTVKDYLTPDVVKKMGALTGESPENTRGAMDRILPALLCGAAKLADSPEGEERLNHLIDQQIGEGNILHKLNDQLGVASATQSLMSSGRDISKALFGDKINYLCDTLASASGVKSSAIWLLLSVTAPMVLAVIGKERSVRGIKPEGLATMLAGEKSIFAQMLPAGMGSVLGWSDIARAEPRSTEPPRTAYATSGEARSERWVWPVVALAALGLLLYSFWPRIAIEPDESSSKREGTTVATAPQESTAAVPVVASEVEQAGRSEVGRAAVSDALSNKGVDIRQVQEALKHRGKNPGPIDGIMGPRTAAALRQFQNDSGLEQTGTLDAATLARLGYDR